MMDTFNDLLQYVPYALVVIGIIALVLNKKKKKGPTLKGRAHVMRRTGHARFMSAAWYKGKLYGGTYNLNSVGVDIHSNGEVTRLSSVKESVYSLDPVKGMLIASCEKARGKTYNADNKALVGPTGLHSTIKMIEAFGKVATLSSNWDKKNARLHIHGGKKVELSGQKFVRDMIVYKDRLHILAFDYGTNTGGMYISNVKDMNRLAWHPMWPGKRPMKAVAYKGGLAITFSPYNGQRIPPAGVLHFKDGSTKVLHTTTLQKQGMGVVVIKGALYYSTLNWNGGGRGSIWTNQSGKWKQLVQFNEHEVLDLATDGKRLFAATGGRGQSGVLYEVK